jgi:hypothetical protein
LASISHRRASDCNWVSEGVDMDERVVVDYFECPDMIVCFLETVEGIMRELYSLSLRTCSKEIEGN